MKADGFRFNESGFMRIVIAIYLVGVLVFNVACAHDNHVETKPNQDTLSTLQQVDPLDSLSQEIVRYLKMHDINNFVGGPAQAFLDSIPFATTTPSFGWEDGWVNAIYYTYEGTNLSVSIHVMDTPYRFNLDTLKMLDLAPEKMFQYNINSICVAEHNKCLIETPGR